MVSFSLNAANTDHVARMERSSPGSRFPRLPFAAASLHAGCDAMMPHVQGYPYQSAQRVGAG